MFLTSVPHFKCIVALRSSKVSLACVVIAICASPLPPEMGLIEIQLSARVFAILAVQLPVAVNVTKAVPPFAIELDANSQILVL